MSRRRPGAFVAVAIAATCLTIASAASSEPTEADVAPPAAPWDEDWLYDEEELGPDPAASDPYQDTNRAIFSFNEGVYRWVLDPVASAYEAVVPAPVRRSVRRFFLNLDEPVTFANDVLQGALGDAGRTATRFTVNSTLGVAGLFDPATAWGVDRHHTDFGQTLAVHGSPAGPYVVLPLLGPATARDAVGQGVDLLLRPDTWLLAATPVFVVNASGGLSAYDVERSRLDALRETSVDFYSAMRGAYLMDRDARVARRIEETRCDGALD